MPAHVLSYPPPSWGKDTRTVLLFFIPGNPGYIGYYEPFLLCLRSLIDSSNGSRSKSAEFHICGQDLAGFNDDDHEPFSSSHQPHNVQYQIDYYLKVLSGLRIPDGPKKGKSYDDIVLMGHSLGTYIALQLFQAVLKDPEPQLHLKSGILLFATVEHLADSPRGKRLDLLRRSPFLSRNAHVIAKAFLSLWPYSALYWYVSTIMGFPKHAATVTTQFLKSRDGVWQALYMGLDELNVIGEGDWDETLWEIAEEVSLHLALWHHRRDPSETNDDDVGASADPDKWGDDAKVLLLLRTQ